jgi:hypothetical protein
VSACAKTIRFWQAAMRVQEDGSMFANLAAAPQTARPAVSGHVWHNRMIHCRASEGRYPIASWQAFVRNYGVKETKVDSQ